MHSIIEVYPRNRRLMADSQIFYAGPGASVSRKHARTLTMSSGGRQANTV